jgi:hypothetical protein
MNVLLIHGGSCEIELRELRQWLETQSCEVDVLDLNYEGGQYQAAAITELITKSDSVVVLLNSSLPLSDAQVALLTAVAQGKKLFGVQLESKHILVDALEKFGSGSLPFDRPLILAAICEEQFEWFDEDGEPRDEPETERHKCKKQSQSNKDAAA